MEYNVWIQTTVGTLNMRVAADSPRLAVKKSKQYSKTGDKVSIEVYDKTANKLLDSFTGAIKYKFHQLLQDCANSIHMLLFFS